MRKVLFSAWPRFDEAETAFWRALAAALHEHDLHLVLASPSAAPPDLGVDHIASVPTIDAFWPDESHSAHIATSMLGLDVPALLARDELWGGPAMLPAIVAHRRHAIERVALTWLETLQGLQPSVVVIWNGQHVPEMILDAAARHGGTPVLYVERAPIPQALFADERGLSAASAVASRRKWPRTGERWTKAAANVIERAARGQCTWWEQPDGRAKDRASLRRELGIAPQQRVVLFGGQVDEDTQQFLFSSRFEHNLAAFRWLLDAVRGQENVFVLGKHHPKALAGPERYRQAFAESGVDGAWHTDLSVDDALLAADRFAAVNSTMLYEALARGLPTLALGNWLLGGRAVAYEISDADPEARRSIQEWLLATDASQRQARWHQCLAYLLSTCIYAYEPQAGAAALQGAAELARRVSKLARRRRRWTPSHGLQSFGIAQRMWSHRTWQVPGEMPRVDEHGWRPDRECWQYAHIVRYQLMQVRAASRNGRDIVIWGTGSAGQLAHSALTAAGVGVRAFVSSQPETALVVNTPVIRPTRLRRGRQRDFVLVASMARDVIVEQLTTLGFLENDDVVIADCDALARLARVGTVTPG